MVIKACRANPATEDLIETLRNRYSIDDQKLDGGQNRIALEANKMINKHWGTNNGCSTYTEALIPALDLTTEQCLDDQNSSLLKYLGEKHSINIPWIAFQKNGEINKENFEVTLAEISKIRNEFIENSSEMSTAEYQYGFAKKIFEHFMPPVSSKLDPDTITWRLYTAMHIADLDTSFALIPVDPLGKSTPLHIALKVQIDDNDSILIDPTYNAFDMKCLPSIQIDKAQALSIYYTQQALKAKNAAPLLSRALHIDPFNTEAKLLSWHVGKGIAYSLAVFNGIRLTNRIRAKNEMAKKWTISY